MFWESEVSISRHGLPAASGVDVYVMQRLLWLVFRSSVVGASLRGSSVSSCLRRLLVLIVVVLEAFDYSSPDTARWLFALVPQHVFHSPTHRCPMPFIWNIVTCHFFDSSILKSALLVPVCFLFALRLEELWGAFTLAQYLGFSLSLSGCCGLLCRIALFAATANAKDFFTPVRGTAGLLTALAVGMAHAFPLTDVEIFGVKLPRAIKFRLKSMPMTVVLSAICGGVVSPAAFADAPFAVGAIFFAWLHIRYMMAFPAAGVLGDHSRDWQFNQLLPWICAW